MTSVVSEDGHRLLLAVSRIGPHVSTRAAGHHKRRRIVIAYNIRVVLQMQVRLHASHGNARRSGMPWCATMLIVLRDATPCRII